MQSSGEGEIVADVEDSTGEGDALCAVLLLAGFDSRTDFFYVDWLERTAGLVEAVHCLGRACGCGGWEKGGKERGG